MSKSRRRLLVNRTMLCIDFVLWLVQTALHQRRRKMYFVDDIHDDANRSWTNR